MARQKLIHIHSFVNGKAPSATTVSFGEIAVNCNSGSPKLYIKTASSTTATTTAIESFSPDSVIDEKLKKKSDTGHNHNNSYAPIAHATSTTTYGLGTSGTSTTAKYGHVKLVGGDLKDQTYSDGTAASVAHTHSQYLTSHQTIKTLTLNAGTFSSGTFKPNTSDATFNIPTQTSHLTNNSGFITSSATVANATNAGTASKLGTNGGDSTTPVYFSNGVPVACTPYSGATVKHAGTADSATTAGSAEVATSATTAGSVAWSGVTGVPTSFTPSSHNHDDKYYTESEVDEKLKEKAPTEHSSTATTYGVGTTEKHGHVKLATGDMKDATHSDGVAVSKNHTHSQYLTSLPSHNHNDLYYTESEITELLKKKSDTGHNHEASGLTNFNTAVNNLIDTRLAANDAMIFKGSWTTGSTIPTAADAGWAYKMSEAGTFYGKKVQIGDMVICYADYSGKTISSSNFDTYYTVIETNNEGMVIGPTSAVSSNFAYFDGNSGKLIKDSGYNASSFAGASHYHAVGAITGGTAGQVMKSNGNSSATWVNQSSLSVGSATSASKLSNTTAIGSATQPVYFSAEGVPVACTTYANASVKYADSAGSATSASSAAVASKLGTNAGSLNQPVYFTNGVPAACTGLPDTLLTWSSSSISGGISPLDMSISTIHSANRLAFINPAGVTIEYSTNKGSSWTNYNPSDGEKINLTNGVGNSFVIGKNSTYTGTSVNNMLRITLDSTSMGVYTRAKKILLNISTSGAGGCKVKVEKSTIGSPTTFTELGTYDITGWSGWNSIPFDTTFGGGSSQTTQTRSVRLTFSIGSKSTNTNYSSSLSVSDILMFGDTYWATTSNMAKTGHLYSYDYNQNAIFPADISGKSFNGFTIGKSVPANAVFTDTTKFDASAITGGTLAIARLTTATTSAYGITKLSSATNSDAEDVAATPKAVKAAYDLANGKYTAATGSTSAYGITKLYSGTDSASESLAATPKAVNTVYKTVTALTATTKTHQDNASTYATNAANSATAAANSATAAANSATAAAGSATSATNAKTAAETAKTAAESAKTAATNAKASAETAATTATNKASAASTSATNAANSATAAATSASNATTAYTATVNALGNYLPKSGGTVTGDLVLNNASGGMVLQGGASLYFKDSSSTNRKALRLTSDVLQLGSTSLPTTISSNATITLDKNTLVNGLLDIKNKTDYTSLPNSGVFGFGQGAIHFRNTGGNDFGNAITWAYNDTVNAQAGIYVKSSGSYGTKMYLATTNAFATGSMASLLIDSSGTIQALRGDFKKADGTLVSYDGHNHNTSYYTKNEVDTKLTGKSDTGHTHGVVGDTNLKLYVHNSNELNFGGENVSSTIYFGYRAIDKKPIPTKFIFGGSSGTSDIVAASFNGFTIGKSVPANALFTDTTKFDASAITGGTLAIARLTTGSTSAYGITKLSSAVTDTSNSVAATAGAVNTVYKAVTATTATTKTHMDNASTYATNAANSATAAGTAYTETVKAKSAAETAMKTATGVTATTLSHKAAAETAMKTATGVTATTKTHMDNASTYATNAGTAYTATVNALGNYLPKSGGTLTGNLQGEIMCAKSRMRVNSATNAGAFGFMDAQLYSSTNNVSTVHIGSCYGGSTSLDNFTESTDLNGSNGVNMTSISMYRRSVGIGKRWTDAELRNLYDKSVALGVDRNALVDGNITATTFYNSGGTEVSYDGHEHDGRYYTESEVDTKLAGKAPNGHSSTANTYGLGTSGTSTTAKYGHVKLVGGDLNNKTYSDGTAASVAHTHGQYALDSDVTTAFSNLNANVEAALEAAGDAATDASEAYDHADAAQTKVKSVAGTGTAYLVGASDSGDSTSSLIKSSIYMSGNTIHGCNGYYQDSDERLKTFHGEVDVDLENLSQLPKAYFTWNESEGGEMQIGTSAQKVREIYPEIVSEDENGKLSVDYSKLSVIALKGVEKLYNKVKTMETELTLIKEKLGL